MIPWMLPTPPIRTTPTSHRDQPKWKCSGLTAAMDETQNPPAIPPKNAGHEKGQELIKEDIDSQRLGGDIIIANGGPGSADLCSKQVREDHGAEGYQDDHQIINLPFRD